jgi:hypothetical protein
LSAGPPAAPAAVDCRWVGLALHHPAGTPVAMSSTDLNAQPEDSSALHLGL